MNFIYSREFFIKTATIILLLPLIAIYCFELFRTAWFCDDAIISFRSVVHFINGYGPIYNVTERVQAYTHPAWFILLSFFSLIIPNVYIASFFLSISISIIVFVIFIVKIPKSLVYSIIPLTLLVLSKSFIDYSTSGLENPLTHFFILMTVIQADGVMQSSEKKVSYLQNFILCLSLLYLTRPDGILLFFPLFCYFLFYFRHNMRGMIRALLIGALPVFIWTFFSLYYYGFPFPNTSYAKLGTQIPLSDLIVQGWNYVCLTDYVSLAAIGLGLLTALFSGYYSRILACGVVMYCLYIISIGGDFMAGRFFSAPLFLASILSARPAFRNIYLSIIFYSLAAYTVLFPGMRDLERTVLSPRHYTGTGAPVNYSNGIADERAFYHTFKAQGMIFHFKQKEGSSGYFPWDYTFDTHPYPTAFDGYIEDVKVTCGALGELGITSGPKVHYIDVCALSDPLLSRLPYAYGKDWRIGHFTRMLPQNYEESIRQDKNLLLDPDTKAFYESIRMITRAPLNNLERWKHIIKINVGLVPYPNSDLYRHK